MHINVITILSEPIYRLSQYGLPLHMVIHTGEFPFACDLCDYKARHRSTLKNFRLNNSGKYAFYCDNCGFKTNES